MWLLLRGGYYLRGHLLHLSTHCVAIIQYFDLVWRTSELFNHISVFNKLLSISTYSVIYSKLNNMHVLA